MIQKITLVLLGGILTCLIIIIAQHRTETHGDGAAQPLVEEAQASEVEQPSPAELPLEPPRTPVRMAAVVTRPAVSTRVTPVGQARPIFVGEPLPEPASSDPLVVSANHSEQPDPPVFATKAVSTAGSITGRVTLVGAAPPEIPIDTGPICGQFHPQGVTTRHYVVSPEGGLANVIVYIESGLERQRFARPTETPVIDQIGCFFEPYVSGVQVRQPFKIRNLDPALHNVHATPKNSREFNFAQALQGQVNEKSFPEPELMVRIKCDVHPWMFAYVNVMRHPYFAISDQDGFYRIPAGLPHGRYSIAAFHLKAGETRTTTVFSPGRPYTVDFQLKAPPRLTRN